MPIKVLTEWKNHYGEDIPVAENPEKASIENGTLCYNLHKFVHELGYRIDAPEFLEIRRIKLVEIFLGANGGFKHIIINVLREGDVMDYIKISNTHKDLAREICKLLKAQGIELKTFREKRKLKS